MSWFADQQVRLHSNLLTVAPRTKRALSSATMRALRTNPVDDQREEELQSDPLLQKKKSGLTGEPNMTSSFM